MSNEVIEFLRNTALTVKNEFKIYDNLYGEIKLNDSEEKLGGMSIVHLSAGSVYGIFAIKKENSDLDKLFKETNNKIKPIDKDNKIFPIYWGKDINQGSRILTHARPRKKTGNAKLEEIKELRNFILIYGYIFISNYEEFEIYLHKEYPPLIGTTRHGNTSRYTKIDN